MQENLVSSSSQHTGLRHSTQSQDGMQVCKSSSPIAIGFSIHVYRELTSWQSEGRDVCEKVARPLALVLFEALAGLFTDTGGQVRVVVGGKSLTGL